jgi:hypothetical protein
MLFHNSIGVIGQPARLFNMKTLTLRSMAEIDTHEAKSEYASQMYTFQFPIFLSFPNFLFYRFTANALDEGTSDSLGIFN